MHQKFVLPRFLLFLWANGSRDKCQLAIFLIFQVPIWWRCVRGTQKSRPRLRMRLSVSASCCGKANVESCNVCSASSSSSSSSSSSFSSSPCVGVHAICDNIFFVNSHTHLSDTCGAPPAGCRPPWCTTMCIWSLAQTPHEHCWSTCCVARDK
jgi:hypothetical protein